MSDAPGGQRFKTAPACKPEALLVTNDLTARVERVILVSTYKYLGGVLTSDASPSAEIQFRWAQAAGIAKPLRQKLFANASIDLGVPPLTASGVVYFQVFVRQHVQPFPQQQPCAPVVQEFCLPLADVAAQAPWRRQDAACILDSP